VSSSRENDIRRWEGLGHVDYVANHPNESQLHSRMGRMVRWPLHIPQDGREGFKVVGRGARHTAGADNYCSPFQPSHRKISLCLPRPGVMGKAMQSQQMRGDGARHGYFVLST